MIEPPARRRLVRSKEHRVLGGVLGGIAENSGFNVAVVRIVFVVATVFSGLFPFVFIYLALWGALSNDPQAEPRPWWKVTLVGLGFVLGGFVLMSGACIALMGALTAVGGGLG